MEKISYYILLLLGFVFPVLLGGCSSDVGSPVVPDVVSGAQVSFAVGGSTSASRAAFPVNTPVRVYVFQRDGNASGVVNLSTTPFKTVEGLSSGSGLLSDITLTGGDIEADGSLVVPGGFTYDFVVVVNATSGATSSSLGTLNTGYLSGFSHGADILAGRREGVEVSIGQTSVNFLFTEYGADSDGNLPHLCSAVLVEARVTQALIDNLGGSLDYAVSGMDFKQCLPTSANLPFSGDPVDLR